MNELNDCNVLINEKFSIINADEEFYSILGERGVYPLDKSIYEEDLYRVEEIIHNLKEEPVMVSFRLIDRSGHELWVVAECSNVEVQDGHRLINLHVNDIDRLRNHNSVIRVLKQQYEKYLEISSNILFYYDPERDILKIFMLSNQEIVFFRGSLEEWKEKKKTSVDADSVMSFEKLCNAMKSKEQMFKYDVKLSLLDEMDSQKWYSFKGRSVKGVDGRTEVMAVVVIMDILSGSTDNETAKYMIRDAGTELLNKRTVTDYAKRLIETKQYQVLTIAIIDIDNFKMINDTYGHMFGDKVIADVADVVREAVGHKGVCGRIGGDEMFIILEDIAANEEVRAILRSIRNNVSWLYHDDPRDIKVTCSIGAACYPSDGSDYDTLFSIADKMLYLAKEKGRNRYIIFQKDVHSGYVNGEQSGLESGNVTFYKFRKTEVVNNLITMYLQNKTESYEEGFQLISRVFDVDSIFIYDLNKKTRTTVYGDDNTTEGDISYFFEDNYIPEFTEDGLKVVDNIGYFETKAPAFFKVFRELGYNQAVQYIVGAGLNGNNIVVSFNRKKQGQKWASMDVSYLAILGNLIGMEQS